MTAVPDSAPDRVAVLGAGTMGAGIALAFALAGSHIGTWSRSAATLEKAKAHLVTALRELDDLGLLHEPPSEIRDRIVLTNDLNTALSGAEAVVETVREDLRDKQQLLRRVSQAVDRSTVITTNTSSLALADVFEEVPAQDRVAGLHWFNPPELVSLVEVVRSEATSDQTVQVLKGWMTALNKTPIVVNHEVAGFIANRLQYALIREAYHLVEQGICDAADVDLAVTSGLGPRWAAIGPFQSMDLAGLDVHLSVAGTLFPVLAQDSTPPVGLQELTRTGALGCKSGQGLLGAYNAERVAELTRSRARVLASLARIKEQEQT